MPALVWDPDDRKPPDAERLEVVAREAAPGAEVKLTLVDDQWLVRALLPAALCARGGSFADRDVSRRIADRLSDEGLDAGVFPRKAGRR